MEYGRLNVVSETHAVTVAEAAYNTLFGIFLPGQSPIWANGVGATVLTARDEEWRVESMHAEITTATGLHLHGRQILLFAPHPPGQPQELLPARQWQNLNGAVSLQQPVEVKRGVGVFLRTPCAIATNIVIVTYSYRVVRHG